MSSLRCLFTPEVGKDSYLKEDESLESIHRKPRHRLDVPVSRKREETMHPNAEGQNETISTAAHTKNECVWRLQAFREVKKWKEMHSPGGADYNFTSNIFTGVAEKQKTTASRRTGEMGVQPQHKHSR